MIEFIPNSDSPYLIDECKIRGNADRVAIPENEDELSALLLECNDRSIPVTISGLRTGLCGGSVPYGGTLVSLERLNSVIGIGEDDRGFYVRTQPCVTVDEIVRMVRLKHVSSISDITDDACARFRSDDRMFFYPVDPTEMHGSIGGNISTNASGPRTFRYGPTRDWVRSVRLMLPDGRTVRITRGENIAKGRHMDANVDGVHLEFDVPGYDFNTDVKNAAGIYARNDVDLLDLIIGSDGIFGVIVEADVYLTEWHPLISNIIFMPDDDSALGLIDDLRHDDVVDPEFLEYFDCGSVDLVRRSCSVDPTILRPPEGRRSAVFLDLPMDGSVESRYERLFELVRRNGGDPSDSWTGYGDKDRERMFRFRHSVPKSIFNYVASLKKDMPAINKMGTDMSVPEERNREMMAEYGRVLGSYGLEYVIFGHLGNCHPHAEIILKDMEDLRKAKEAYAVLARRAFELGGSPSAEHGIGKLKRDYIMMMYGAEGTEGIRRMKMAFDPNMILNRGNIIE